MKDDGSWITRPLDLRSAAEQATVAANMRRTLDEVLGAERSAEVHTPAEIAERLRWHLEPAPGRRAAVLVAAGRGGGIGGHTLLRAEPWEQRQVGLFASTWVEPDARRRGVASALLEAGETWMRAQALTEAFTWTDPGNGPLLRLFEARGYSSSPLGYDWVVLRRVL